MYVPLARFKRDLNQPGKVNTHLGGIDFEARAPLQRRLKQRYTLADVGLRLRTLEKPGCLSLESDSAADRRRGSRGGILRRPIAGVQRPTGSHISG